MENSVVKLKVNSGYQIVRKTKKVDIGTAYELLNTKQQKNYTEAIIHGDYAELVWHVVRCPYCGKETSLYEKENKRARRKILSEELVVMTGEQFSMLDKVESVIRFNEKKEPEDVHLCPKCGQFSEHSEEESEITIIHEENSINVFRIIKDMKSLIDVKWNDKITFGNAFPLYEKVSFDFEKGETSISLTDKEGNIICVKTVTRNIVEKEKSPLIELLQRNYALRRKVGKEFRSHTKDLSAISPDECVFERFVAFTCYRGFDEYFYDAIPYEFDFYADLIFADKSLSELMDAGVNSSEISGEIYVQIKNKTGTDIKTVGNSEDLGANHLMILIGIMREYAADRYTENPENIVFRASQLATRLLINGAVNDFLWHDDGVLPADELLDYVWTEPGNDFVYDINKGDLSDLIEILENLM